MPWITHLLSARQRCTNPKLRGWNRYGGRGIRCELTAFEIESVWFRDNAMDLKRPSLDRIDNEGHYVLENVRFIEMAENSRKVAIDRRLRQAQRNAPARDSDGNLTNPDEKKTDEYSDEKASAAKRRSYIILAQSRSFCE